MECGTASLLCTLSRQHGCRPEFGSCGRLRKAPVFKFEIPTHPFLLPTCSAPLKINDPIIIPDYNLQPIPPPSYSQKKNLAPNSLLISATELRKVVDFRREHYRRHRWDVKSWFWMRLRIYSTRYLYGEVCSSLCSIWILMLTIAYNGHVAGGCFRPSEPASRASLLTPATPCSLTLCPWTISGIGMHITGHHGSWRERLILPPPPASTSIPTLPSTGSS